MSKGGARYGAGRPGYRLKAEHCNRLDIRFMRKRGFLKPGSYNLSWKCGDEPRGTIDAQVFDADQITLHYRFKGYSDEVWRDVVQRVPLETTPCRFGGVRQRFKCPCCYRRVEVLYLRSGRFACRHCQQVAYTSQSECPIGRITSRTHKLKAIVEGGKPKGMRWRTYNRICDRIDALDSAWLHAMKRRFLADGWPL
jgi:hypothetical protein